MMDEDFIENVITPETETTDSSYTMNINRVFHGMEAVAAFDEQLTEDFGEARDGLRQDLGGDNK